MRQERPHEALSDIEVDVLRRLSRPASASEVAHQLGCTLQDLTNLLIDLRQRLDVSSTAAAIRWAVGRGLW